jgi:hypothetical protein
MPFGRNYGGVATPRSSGSADAPNAIRSVTDASGNVGWQVRLFKPSGAALSVGQTLRVAYVGAVSGNPQVAAVASGTATFDRLVVASAATASGTWDWYYFEGYCKILVEGTTDVASADFLKSVAGTSTTALIKDGSTRSANSFAIAIDGQTANSEVLTLCYLLGDQATCV